MLLESIITCPHCAKSKSETMPTDACQFFYDCKACGRYRQLNEYGVDGEVIAEHVDCP